MLRNRHSVVIAIAAVLCCVAFPEAGSNGITVQSSDAASKVASAAATAAAAVSSTSPGVTNRTSVTDTGGQATHGGSDPLISGNGRWQIFSSLDALQPSSPGAQQDRESIFVRDLQKNTTIQLSIGTSFTTGAPQPPTADSFLPSISDDGRYVSFVTGASNIVPVSVAQPQTLVVCDRDPNGDNVFDEINPANGSLTNVCKSVYSTARTDPNAIYTFDRPQIAGFGGRIVWTEQSSSGTHAWTSGIAPGGVFGPDTPIQVPMLITNPVGCGVIPSGSQPNESEPVITDNSSEVIVSVIFPGVNGCTGIVGTNNLDIPSFSSSTRYDVVPAGCGFGFLGDHPTLSGPCAGGTGGAVNFVGEPAIDKFASTILFHYHDGPGSLGFAAPHAALGTDVDTDWMVLTQLQFSGTTSQVVSRDNNNAIVNSSTGALSEDARFVAFDTADPNAHDGVDVTGDQLVARDLVVDAARAAAGQSRLPGALVTPHDSSLPNPVGCAPPAGQLCASSGGGVASVSFDATGARVSFQSDAPDLVAGDSNNTDDAFVHTWQPTLTNNAVDFGPVQVGTHSSVNITVTASGFGPISFDPVAPTVIGGTDASQFSAGPTNCTFLHVGETCVVGVNFSPTTPGAKTATVSLVSDQFATPQQVATVTGLGTLTGPVSAPADNTRTSVKNNGGQSPTGGSQSMISGNGRWQVFVSDSNLTGRTPIDPADSNLQNVFVRDLADPQHTVQISLHTDVATNPTKPRPVATAGHPKAATPNGSSSQPSISSDGRFVSFVTDSTDIVQFPPLASDPATFVLVVCDRDPTNARDNAGNPILDLPRKGTKVPNYVCFPVQSGGFFVASPGLSGFNQSSQLSGDGTRITWVEDANNANPRVRVATLSTPGGALKAPSNFRYVRIFNIPPFIDGGKRVPGQTAQGDPTLTEDGNAVVFTADNTCSSFAATCPPAAIIETDLIAGTSFRFDISPGGVPLGDAGGQFDAPAMSDDGTRVAFAFRDTTQNFKRVYVATRSGAAVTTVIASRDNNGAVSAGSSPALSGDGRYLAFETSQPNEHNAVDPPNGSCFDNGTNANVFCQIVARDLVKDAAQPASAPWVPSEIVSSSISTNCPNPLPPGRKCGANSGSFNPSVDATGSEIGFDTDADDVVPGDTNVIVSEGTSPATDSFVHTWRPTLSTTPAFDFGTVKLGAHLNKTFTVTESGFGPISLGATSIAGLNPTDFKLLSTTCTGQTLNDTQQCLLKIRFTPKVPGSRLATLSTVVGKNGYPRHNPQNTISYDPALVRTLTGFGASPVTAVNPKTLNFGNQLPENQPGVTKTVTVTNTGTSTLIIGTVVVNDTTHPGSHLDYTVDATSCAGGVPPGGSCVITVTFVGHAVGKRDAVLVISDNSPGSPTIVTLLANVPKPTVAANPGVSPPGRVVIVTGTGFAPNRVVDIVIKGHPESAHVKTDAHGGFTTGLVVFETGSLGPRVIVAHSHAVSSTISAKGPLLLVLGSLDSPIPLVIRH